MSRHWPLVLVLWLAALPGAAASEDGSLRIAQLLPGADPVEVKLSSDTDGGSERTFGSLSFRQISDYKDLPPGRYGVTVRLAGETVLEASYGIGSTRRYTLVLYGVLAGEAPQPVTTWKKVTSWFSGLEASVPNGWVAQHRMLLDEPGRTLGQGRVRIMHAAPGFSTLHLQLENRDARLSYGTLRYPQMGGHQEIAAGSWTVVVTPPNSPLQLLSRHIDVKPNAMVTIFVTGSVEPLRGLELVIASSPPALPLDATP